MPWMLPLAAAAWAGTAHFDGVPEGTVTSQLTEDGVILSDLDQRLPGSNPTMVAEDASGSLGGLAGFSPDNVLAFGGWAPGPGASFGRFGSLRIRSVDPADTATIEVFHLGNSGVQLTLEAWIGGRVVDSTSTVLAGWTVGHVQLHLQTEPFDFLRLVAGTTPDEAAFLALDDVHLELSVPPADSDTASGDSDTDTVQPAVDDVGDSDTDGVDSDRAARGADDTDAPVTDDTEVDVPDPYTPPSACGCDDRGAGPVGWWALLALLGAGARRRR
ncbi:MAG: GlyGly-CTERM sorting domain-containing protein [Alphaproteobacteria bacterium]|nr:GlyGly-CTERM sorting domain-containing protein [Alphaproteobacteria bacterium]